MSYPFLSIAAAIAVSTGASYAAVPATAQNSTAAKPAPRPASRTEVLKVSGESFDKLDTNHDRILSAAEIDAAQARSQSEVSANIGRRMTQEFTKLDADKNGQLSLAEFLAASPNVRRPAANASATAVQRLDTNKDGKISIEEYRAPILASFNRIDANGDGTISPAERAKAQAARAKK